MKLKVPNKIIINEIKDLDKLRAFVEQNNTDVKLLNISQLAREAGCSRGTVRNRLKASYKGYPATKPSKVDKVRHLVLELFDDPIRIVYSKVGLYRYLKREYPEFVDFKENTFRYYLNKHFKEKLHSNRNQFNILQVEASSNCKSESDIRSNITFIDRDGLIKTLSNY